MKSVCKNISKLTMESIAKTIYYALNIITVKYRKIDMRSNVA